MSDWIRVDRFWRTADIELVPGMQIEIRHRPGSDMANDFYDHPGISIGPQTYRYLIGDLDAHLSMGDDGDWFAPEDVVLRYRALFDEKELAR